MLGGLAVLALIVLALTSIIQLRIQSASNIVAASRAEALADAGVMLAIARLLVAADGNVFHRAALPPGQGTFTCSWRDEGTLLVAIADEAGKIDINTASDELLFKFVRAVAGADNEAAWTIVDRIADYRDTDDLKRTRGAESSDYELSGAFPRPKNAPFETLGELEHVIGSDAKFVRQILPFVTIHSRQLGVDLNVAPPALVEALRSSGMTLEGADYLAITSPGRTFRIDSIGQTTDRARFSRSAIVELYPSPGTVFVIHEWEHSVASKNFAINPAAEAARVSDCKQ